MTTQHIDIHSVTQQYQQQREQYPETFRLRMHRAVSWLKRAMRDEQTYLTETMGKAAQQAKLPWQKLPVDWDMRFVNLWIAFNAAYANEIDGRKIAADKSDFRLFLQKLCRLDSEKLIHQWIWETFSGRIRLFLDKPHVFQAFWDYKNGEISLDDWEKHFSAAKRKAQTALIDEDTDTVLMIIFDRLYTLRNQIFHGGATFDSSVNREQLQDACMILGGIVPIILHIMLCHAQEDWGKPYYPYIAGD